MSRLAWLGGVVLDTVFPPRCAGCGRRGRWVCDECLGTTPHVAEPLCARCGVPLDQPCRCHDLPSELDVLRSALWYDGWVRPAIQAFKYEGERARAGHLAAYPAAMMATLADAVIVAVPLHPDRRRSRGYNQAELIARELARRSDLPVHAPLVRVRATQQQIHLHASERAGNVHGAFALAEGVDVRGGRFVLVDDVVTTGATLGACAAAMKQAGAAWVGALTVARDR